MFEVKRENARTWIHEMWVKISEQMIKPNDLSENLIYKLEIKRECLSIVWKHMTAFSNEQTRWILRAILSHQNKILILYEMLWWINAISFWPTFTTNKTVSCEWSDKRAPYFDV